MFFPGGVGYPQATLLCRYADKTDSKVNTVNSYGEGVMGPAPTPSELTVLNACRGNLDFITCDCDIPRTSGLTRFLNLAIP